MKQKILRRPKRRQKAAEVLENFRMPTVRLDRSLGRARAFTGMSCLWALVLFGGVLIGCKRKNETPAPAASAAASKSGPPCPGGQSVDPSQSEFRPAISAFKDMNYSTAQALLDTLMTKYPSSSTVRVWRGDAALFDKKAEYKQAADAALAHYRQAEDLHDQGCKLPEVEHYYLRFDSALASLRKGEAEPAIRQLELSKSQWADSAEVFYNLARAYCLKNEVDACHQNFEQALNVAKSLKRPKFLRSQYSVDDWIRRSKTQSEFPPLRKDKRYASLIQKQSK